MAQQLDRMRRISVLMGFPNDAQGQARVTVIRQELLKLGWAVGRNAHIDIRWAAGDPGLTQTYAAELVQLKPDVIIANSSLGVSAFAARDSHNSRGLHGDPRSGRARIC
jgi:putative ABC transport system substrate-binding protein